MTLFNLETILKEHKENCQSSTHDSMVKSFKNDKSLDDNTRKDMIALKKLLPYKLGARLEVILEASANLLHSLFIFS